MSTLWTAVPLECANTSIRIFTIDRFDDKTANLHCTFRVASLIEDPNFTAISYTWRNALGPRESPFEQGLPPATHDNKTIICNGFEVPILDNLHHALLQLHTSYASGTRFWADALCINQSNISERSQQVSAMSMIFKTAQFVIIWLGPGTKTVSKALEFVELMASLSAEAMQAFAFGNPSSEPISSEVRYKLSLQEAWEALELFFSRSWFIRAWIVQETLLAAQLTVMCGGQTIAWEKLQLTSHYLMQFAQNLAPLHPAFFTEGVYFDTPARLGAGRGNQFAPGMDGLLYSLIRSRKHLCQDPRDTVFSLVGIARVKATYQTEHPLPVPDYEATPASVFHQTALHILGVSNKLLLLAYAEGSKYRQIDGLPSWVPDWSVRKGLGLAYTGYKSFQADSGRPCYAELKFDKRVLAIEVAMVDSVTMVGETKESVLRTGHFPQWLAILASLPVVSLHGQSRKQVLWRTLLTDIVPDHNGLHHPAPQEFDELFDSWLRGCVQMSQQRKRHADGSLEPAADTGVSVYATASQHGLHWLCDLLTTTRESVTAEGDVIRAARFRTVYSNSLHVRLFRTAKGHLGVGSESIREGDDVCIASGSRVPLVVRPRQKVAGQKLQYELVGAAYVHGIMHGEALRCSSVGFQTVELA